MGKPNKNMTYDEGSLEYKRNVMKENSKDWNKKQKDDAQGLTDQIFYHIDSFTKNDDGIMVKTLAKLVNRTPRCVGDHLKPLRETGKIKTSKINGKLVSVFNPLEDPIINAQCFGNECRKNILKKDKHFILSNFFKSFNQSNLGLLFDSRNIKFNDTTQNFNWNHRIDVKTYEQKFTKEDNIEEFIFEYSNRIGAFVTYLLMYAMNPENHKEDKDRDKIVSEIIKKGILFLTSFLAPTFKEHLDKSNGEYPFSNYDEGIKYLKKKPRYVIDNPEIMQSLLIAFARVYPILNFEFEKIMQENDRHIFKEVLKDYPSKITEGYKQEMREIYESLKKREQQYSKSK